MKGTAAIATRAHCRQPGLNEPENQAKIRLFYYKDYTATEAKQVTHFRAILQVFMASLS